MGLLLPGPSKYRLGSDGSSPHLSVTVLFTSVLLWFLRMFCHEPFVFVVCDQESSGPLSKDPSLLFTAYLIE